MQNKMLSLIVAAWLSSLPLMGAPFIVDMEQSVLAVDAKASPPHTFTSTAKTFQCDIEIDPTTLNPGKAVVSFNFSDLDSEKEKRDKKMLSWMDAETHPLGQFELFEVVEREGGTVGLGTFQMHGVSLPIEVPFAINRTGETITIEGTAEFDYTKWDLKIVRLLIFTVNPDVKVHFRLVGNLSSAS